MGIFYEHCSEIWGGSPTTAAIPDGLESSENLEESSYVVEDIDKKVQTPQVKTVSSKQIQKMKTMIVNRHQFQGKSL